MATKKETQEHEQWIRQIVRDEIGKCLKSTKQESYTSRIRCRNCGEFADIAIPKGTTIYDYLTQPTTPQLICPQCGVGYAYDRIKPLLS